MTTGRNYWPLGIVLALALFMVGTASLIVLAASHKPELVSGDYYEQELKFQTRIESLDRAVRLGATTTYDAAGKRIILSLPAGHARRNPVGGIQLYRPSAVGLDRNLSLAPDAQGMQTIDASHLEPGLWKVRVAWTVDGQDYLIDRTITNLAVPSDGVSTP